MARVFSRAGLRVVIADIRRDGIDRALADFLAGNPGVLGLSLEFELDVAHRAACVRATNEVERTFGRFVASLHR